MLNGEVLGFFFLLLGREETSAEIIYFFMKLMDEILRNYVREIDDMKEKNRDKSPINKQALGYPLTG